MKGPRQVGKASLLERSDPHRTVIRCDDHAIRNFAKDNPRMFLDQFEGPILIDEAPLVVEFDQLFEKLSELLGD